MMPKAKPNKPTIRSKVWKLLLEVHHVSAQEYISLVKQGKPQEYSKIRNDTFRTLATDRKFLDVVEEDSLIRVLCAFAWSTQGKNEWLLLPFLICSDEILLLLYVLIRAIMHLRLTMTGSFSFHLTLTFACHHQHL